MPNLGEKVLSEAISTPDEKLWLECFNCKVPCSHLVLAMAQIEWSIADGAERQSNIHQLVQCGGCRKIGYREVMALIDPDHPESVATFEELFPRREDRTKRRRKWMEGVEHVAKRPRTIYLETLRALNLGQPVLAGVGIRAVVECVCKHKRVTGTDLRIKINALGTAGVLGPAEVKLMHRLRFLGNRAAHEGNPPPQEDLDAAMNITEHLLRAVYIAPKMARGLPKRSRLKSRP